MEPLVHPPIEVPTDSLSEDILEAVIESFILREGTDYGIQEVSLQTKMAQVRRQIDKKQIRIVFDFATESVTLLTEQDWQKLRS